MRPAAAAPVTDSDLADLQAGLQAKLHPERASGAARPKGGAPAQPWLLWLNPREADGDWALATEIVLHDEATLRPFQSTGLRAFIEVDREARFARLNADCRQPAAGSRQPAGSAAAVRR